MIAPKPTIPHEMRAGRILGPRRSEVATVAVPTPGPGEVLIEVARAGICGTDLHILDGDYELARFPMTPGHEFAGTIVALGEGVRLRRIGERVTADPNLPCGICPECQRGAVNQCHDLAVVGVSRDGAFARYVNVPEGVVVPIGDLSFAEGALVEPLACVVWGLERIRVRAGDHALVFGAGPMGCLLIQALKSCGAARVAVVDVAPARLALARTWAPTWRSRPTSWDGSPRSPRSASSSSWRPPASRPSSRAASNMPAPAARSGCSGWRRATPRRASPRTSCSGATCPWSAPSPSTRRSRAPST
jgi:Zn-dependent alcohol dehydrogenase